MTTISELIWRFPDSYWYIATEYSKWPGGLEDAARMASRLEGRLIEQGLAAYVPIPSGHAACLEWPLDALDHEIWMRRDKIFCKWACGLIIADTPTWHESKGIAIELGWFREWNRPIFLLNTETLELRSFK